MLLLSFRNIRNEHHYKSDTNDVKQNFGSSRHGNTIIIINMHLLQAQIFFLQLQDMTNLLFLILMA